MALNAEKLRELIAALYDLREAKAQGLIENPQDEEIEVAVKAAIDVEIEAA